MVSPTDSKQREKLSTAREIISWPSIKLQIERGSLHDLARHPNVQQKYEWQRGYLIDDYGSMENYLQNHRLCGHIEPRPEGLSLLCETTPPVYYKIMQNDWPYMTPRDIQHMVLWTSAPLLPADGVTPLFAAVGLCGFAGAEGKEGTENQRSIRGARHSTRITQFLQKEWPAQVYELAWFIRPKYLLSVHDVSSIHVFVRGKVNIKKFMKTMKIKHKAAVKKRALKRRAKGRVAKGGLDDSDEDEDEEEEGDSSEEVNESCEEDEDEDDNESESDEDGDEDEDEEEGEGDEDDDEKSEEIVDDDDECNERSDETQFIKLVKNLDPFNILDELGEQQEQPSIKRQSEKPVATLQPARTGNIPNADADSGVQDDETAGDDLYHGRDGGEVADMEWGEEARQGPLSQHPSVVQDIPPSEAPPAPHDPQSLQHVFRSTPTVQRPRPVQQRGERVSRPVLRVPHRQRSLPQQLMPPIPEVRQQSVYSALGRRQQYHFQSLVPAQQSAPPVQQLTPLRQQNIESAPIAPQLTYQPVSGSSGAHSQWQHLISPNPPPSQEHLPPAQGSTIYSQQTAPSAQTSAFGAQESDHQPREGIPAGIPEWHGYNFQQELTSVQRRAPPVEEPTNFPERSAASSDDGASPAQLDPSTSEKSGSPVGGISEWHHSIYQDAPSTEESVHESASQTEQPSESPLSPVLEPPPTTAPARHPHDPRIPEGIPEWQHYIFLKEAMPASEQFSERSASPVQQPTSAGVQVSQQRDPRIPEGIPEWQHYIFLKNPVPPSEQSLERSASPMQKRTPVTVQASQPRDPRIPEGIPEWQHYIFLKEAMPASEQSPERSASPVQQLTPVAVQDSQERDPRIPEGIPEWQHYIFLKDPAHPLERYSENSAEPILQPAAEHASQRASRISDGIPERQHYPGQNTANVQEGIYLTEHSTPSFPEPTSPTRPSPFGIEEFAHQPQGTISPKSHQQSTPLGQESFLQAQQRFISQVQQRPIPQSSYEQRLSHQILQHRVLSVQQGARVADLSQAQFQRLPPMPQRQVVSTQQVIRLSQQVVPHVQQIDNNEQRLMVLGQQQVRPLENGPLKTVQGQPVQHASLQNHQQQQQPEQAQQHAQIPRPTQMLQLDRQGLEERYQTVVQQEEANEEDEEKDEDEEEEDKDARDETDRPSGLNGDIDQVGGWPVGEDYNDFDDLSPGREWSIGGLEWDHTVQEARGEQ